jgi:signal transduction histidine kinase
MFYSLRFGILLAMLAIGAVAITTTTIFVGLTTRAQFTRYIEIGREIREARLQQAVIMWVDGDATQDFDAAEFMRFLTSSDTTTGSSYSLNVAADAVQTTDFTSENTGTVRFEIAPDGGATVYQGNDVIGTLYVDPISDLALQSAQNAFVESLNWTLLITAILAALAAIALTVILSRRILHPVAALTIAARRLESGDLQQRVNVHATGEIGELAHAFNAMAETLSKNEELRQSMVSDIAHELRTPVTNIRGYLEAIQDGIIEPTDMSVIDSLFEEAVLLNGLIQDLQELALAEAGALHYELHPVSLDDVVEQTISMLQPSASSKQITLSSHLPDDMPPVTADYRRVSQVLRNLINNAIRHTPPDGEITVSAEIHANEIEVKITDTGEGIDAENLPFLFERFWRADPSRSRVTGGAGLGLAIVKQLVEAQGGRVQVQSVKGKGSTFCFTLPRYPEPVFS